ncbi:hypothetical protein [Methanofollis fontis]|uniref:Uncharacterized protein n=1 Tax=Methanofollis fontis TaxID=2052832 RepID=A0A483CRH6_9EURY|nr:hypothetical protein [Methanofollis fontis]TAJ43921.1 hypothetical protein CUJ86_07645 [Methanofollis fontis]
MPYRWTSNQDVDEAVVVIMNALEEGGAFPEWLRRTLQAAIDDSDPAYVRYFYDEIKKFAPKSLKLFGETPVV